MPVAKKAAINSKIRTSCGKSEILGKFNNLKTIHSGKFRLANLKITRRTRRKKS